MTISEWEEFVSKLMLEHANGKPMKHVIGEAYTRGMTDQGKRAKAKTKLKK